MARRPRRNPAGNPPSGTANENAASRSDGIAQVAETGGEAGATAAEIPGTFVRTETGAATFDPASFTGGSTEQVATFPGSADSGTVSTGKRGPGRPPGSTSRQKPTQINISGVEKLLLGIHATLHAAFKAPELELDEAEAKEIAKAYGDVAALYPALQIPAEVTAIANLAGVVSIVYGSRITAYRARMAGERRQRPQKAQPFTPPNAPVPNQMNGAAPPDKATPIPVDLRKGEIPGIGEVEFPEDHPLMRGNKVN